MINRQSRRQIICMTGLTKQDNFLRTHNGFKFITTVKKVLEHFNKNFILAVGLNTVSTSQNIDNEIKPYFEKQDELRLLNV